MRINILLFLVTTLLSVQAGLSPLEALSMIESGNNDQAVGKLGEVSRYQILPRVWRSYSKGWNYRNPQLASKVAAKHLHFLESGFRERAGREPSDFDRYVLWNAGLAYYTRIEFSQKRVHSVIRGRANRYVNLREMKRTVPASLK